MHLTPDFLFEREALKEQLKKWKWLFCLALIIFIIILSKNSLKTDTHHHIARIRIDGVIEHDPELLDTLKEIGKNVNIKAVILHINSPGSTAFGGEELYYALKQLTKNKPIVSVLETVAASGGYMIALGTDYIVARNMTITGSIGVIWQSFEAVELANKLGIKFISFKSSPLKAAPNPMEAITPDAEEAAMETIKDSYQVFLKMLMEGRKMPEAQALKLADGRVYTGKRAKELKLIDAIGGEDEALVWLETERKIPNNIKIEDINWNKPRGFLQELSQFFRNTNSMLGKILGHSSVSMAIAD